MYLQLGSNGSEWWIGLPEDAKYGIAMWVLGESERQGLPFLWDGTRAALDSNLRDVDRSVADGGGFVVGTSRLCWPTSPGAVTRVVSSDQPCPPGTGGVGGEAPVEMSPEEVRRRLEETRRRERMTVVRRQPKLTFGPPSKPEDLEQPKLTFDWEEKSDGDSLEARRPWYKSPWLWGGAGVLVVTGALAAVYYRRRRTA